MKDRMTLLIALLMLYIVLVAAACGGNAAKSPASVTTATRRQRRPRRRRRIRLQPRPRRRNCRRLRPQAVPRQRRPPARSTSVSASTAATSGSVTGTGTAGVGSSSNTDCAAWAAGADARILELPMMLGAGESKITVALTRVGAYTGPGTYELKAQASGGHARRIPHHRSGRPHLRERRGISRRSHRRGRWLWFRTGNRPGRAGVDPGRESRSERPYRFCDAVGVSAGKVNPCLRGDLP